MKGEVYTNGIESLGSLLKRAHKGTFHKLSQTCLDRYVQQFARSHDLRNRDNIDQMNGLREAMESERLRNTNLLAGNGRSSGARC